MELPCAAPFISQPETSDKPAVKHPMDLSMIHQKLENGGYGSFSQWEKDMTLIWTNAEKSQQKDTYLLSLAQTLRDHFKKECRRYKRTRFNGWFRDVSSICQKMTDLFQTPPSAVGAIMRLPGRDAREEMKPMTEPEIATFIRMSRYLDDPKDSQEMRRLISIHEQIPLKEVEMGEIDVSDLKKDTMYALRDYLAVRLCEMNIAYPTLRL